MIVVSSVLSCRAIGGGGICRTNIIYLDYRKAFDTVPHRRLLEKLKNFGLSEKLIQWLDNFLTSRTMNVVLRGTFSHILEVLSGVPQGSVLGPLLFLLFVNELPSWIMSDMKMFADDTRHKGLV